MAKKITKDEVLSLRIDTKTKKELSKMADERRRKLSDFLQLILVDVANNKVKLPF